jgi:hypothetical protein
MLGSVASVSHVRAKTGAFNSNCSLIFLCRRQQESIIVEAAESASASL